VARHRDRATVTVTKHRVAHRVGDGATVTVTPHRSKLTTTVRDRGQ